MRMQDSQANCGPFALKNALCALGIERSAEELEKACGTSATNGTPTKGLVKAASKIDGCDPQVIRESKSYVALLLLEHALRQGRPVILCFADSQGNPGEHWVAAVGVLGDRYLVADSADSELVISLGVTELEAKWRDTRYEGVIL
jgi:ABC-type bacteriocin/lantibiotic exporter with double-glycine peptidase domain